MSSTIENTGAPALAGRGFSAALDYAGTSHRLAAVFLLLFSLLAFLPGFFQIPPVDRDEARFAQATKQMLETRDVDQRFAQMEKFLLGRFSSRLVVDRCVEYAVGEMSRNPSRLNMSRMNSKIGYSQKHFISMFKRRVGLTPKAYLKIMRFQKVIAAIEEVSVGSIDWSAIANDCGFFDQSHFINDFRLFSGFTPEDYLSKKSDYLNYVPVG